MFYLADTPSLQLLGENILGELKGKVDDEEEQLSYGQTAKEHTRVNIVSSEKKEKSSCMIVTWVNSSLDVSIMKIIEETDVARDSNYEDQAVKNQTGN